MTAPEERGVVGELALLVVEQSADDASHRLLGGQAGGEVSAEQVDQCQVAEEGAGRGEPPMPALGRYLRGPGRPESLLEGPGPECDMATRAHLADELLHLANRRDLGVLTRGGLDALPLPGADQLSPWWR